MTCSIVPYYTGYCNGTRCPKGKMTASDKYQCMCPAIFSSEQCMNPRGECIVMWKNERTNALIFVIYMSAESYQSVTSFMHVIKELLCNIYFEIRSNYQNNIILSEIQFSIIIKMDQANAALIRPRYALLRDTMTQLCIVRYQWMVLNWLIPLPQQLPLATSAHEDILISVWIENKKSRSSCKDLFIWTQMPIV